ncbi:hypothetical protein BHM03_00003122 [Ensete ventricosum]|nr:hypothetical protein BHM03_00003122 [Ensete ventricosum]
MLLFPFSPATTAIATASIPTTMHNSMPLWPPNQQSLDPRHSSFLPLPLPLGSPTLPPITTLLPSSSYASSPRPVVAANRRPHCCLPHLPHASRYRLCYQPSSVPLPLSQPLLPVVVAHPCDLVVCLQSQPTTDHTYLLRSPIAIATRRCPLPPSLANRLYRSQALLHCSQTLLCHDLDLLFFITTGQPLPSSLITIADPSIALAPCFLYHCSRHNLLLGRTLLCHQGTLAPSSSPAVAVAPKHQHDFCPSCHCHWPPLFLPSAPHDASASSLAVAARAAEAISNRTLTAAPHCCTSLLPLMPPPCPTSFLIYW